jgi:hypothetical protein
MASPRGTLVFFKRVRRKATKAKPYLKPAVERGIKVLNLKIRKLFATTTTTDPTVIRTSLERAVRESAFAALQVAQRKVPVDTGRLRASLNARRYTVTGMIWTVGTNVRYGRYVEEGTRAGTRNGPYIYPTRARVLRFRWRNAPPHIRRQFRRKRKRGR